MSPVCGISVMKTILIELNVEYYNLFFFHTSNEKKNLEKNIFGKVSMKCDQLGLPRKKPVKWP